MDCFHNLGGHFGFIHSINMDIVDTVFLKIPDLADGIVDTGFAHIVRVLAIDGKKVSQRLGDG